MFLRIQFTAAAFPLRVGFGFWRVGNGGDFVLILKIEEPDAPGAAAGGADGFGVDADDFAKLADCHELAGLVDEIGLTTLVCKFRFNMMNWRSFCFS